MNELTAKWSKSEKELYLTALSYILEQGSKNNAARKEFLKNKAEELNISATAAKKIKSSAELISLLKAIRSIKTKRFIVRDMILLTIADHDMEENEICTIYEIGTKIGLSPTKIDDFCLWAAKGLDWQMEGISLINEDL